MDFDKYWHASEIEFYTDASKNFSLGFGGYCERSWIPINQNKKKVYSGEYIFTPLYLFWG